MPTPSARPARVAILGFGHVGSAVAARLARDRVAGLQLTHIFDRRPDAKRSGLSSDQLHDISAVAWTDDIERILSGDADLVVEALGGVEPAHGWIRAALARGKSVVTANKQVVARHGRELLGFAWRQGRQLRFEAAVGGAMPVVAALREALAGDRITRIEAILNGTSTFVLSRVEATGCAIADAVAEARTLGLTEADPAADTHGHDAAAKLAILCGLAFGVEIDPDRIPREPIDAIGPGTIARARRRGRAIRQVASASYDPGSGMLVARVGPRELARESFLGRVDEAGNAALIYCERAGAIGLFGRGAGGDASAVAIVSDLLAIARDPAAVVPPPCWSAPVHVTSCGAPSALAEAI